MKKSLLLLFIIAFASCNSDHSASQNEAFKPNILWLVAEDMSPTIPSFGDSTIITPNLSRLAAEGVCYDNFYSPAPVCAPARSAIALGMYPTRIGSNHMRTGPWFSDNITEQVLEWYKTTVPEDIPIYEAIPPDGALMLSQYMQSNGYYCTNNAKRDYQFIMPPGAWNESSNKAHWRNRNEQQPFFAVFNFGVTHESAIWNKKLDSLYVPDDLEVEVPPYLPQNEIGQTDVRKMYSNILRMDEQVGKILEELEADGLLESTIIFWYTDHGGPLPRQKRLLYDSGLKVPLIIRFPNALYKGTRNDEMISFIDLAPTVLDMTRSKHFCPYFDGASFAPIGFSQVAELQEKERQYIFAAADRFDEVSDHSRAVRDKRYKYIKHYEPQKSMHLAVGYRKQMASQRELDRMHQEGTLDAIQSLWYRDTKPEEELFDTEMDPHEIHNLADDPAYADKLMELRAANQEWIKATHDLCLQDEHELIKKIWPDGKQPVSQSPRIVLEEQMIILESEFPSEQISYRWKSDDSKAWQYYIDKIPAKVGDEIEVIAHRIGYKSSTIISKKIDE